jgi:tetratricopeptide (TPR) repeat protein
VQGCDRALVELLSGHYGRALQQLEGAPTAGRTEGEQANLRGLAQMMAGDAKGAAASFDLALDASPALAEARFNRGVARLKLRQYAQASADFESVAGDGGKPLSARAAYHDALALDALARSSDAERWLERALAVDPKLDSALLYLGFLRERRGDLQAAGKSYRQFLDRHPQSTVAMLRFGISAQRSGFPDTGRKYLRQVIAAAPDSPEAAEARKFLVMWE